MESDIQFVAFEPQIVEDVGLGLSEPVRGALARAVEVVLETVEERRRA